jgi:hypothetical protein
VPPSAFLAAKKSIINYRTFFFIRECLLSGKTESPLITLDESLILAEIMQVWKQFFSG